MWIYLATAAPSSALDFQCESHPVVYIVGFELSLLNLHPNTAQVIRVKTDKQAVNDISKLNPQFSFYILSPESAPPALLANQFLRHYYYVPEPVLHAGKTLTIRDRVTNIGSIERFSSELYTDLAQYYRDKAYKALLEQHDREEIKVFLEKSKKCLEMLKYIIESFAANTMEVPVTT